MARPLTIYNSIILLGHRSRFSQRCDLCTFKYAPNRHPRDRMCKLADALLACADRTHTHLGDSAHCSFNLVGERVQNAFLQILRVRVCVCVRCAYIARAKQRECTCVYAVCTARRVSRKVCGVWRVSVSVHSATAAAAAAFESVSVWPKSEKQEFCAKYNIYHTACHTTAKHTSTPTHNHQPLDNDQRRRRQHTSHNSVYRDARVQKMIVFVCCHSARRVNECAELHRELCARVCVRVPRVHALCAHYVQYITHNHSAVCVCLSTVMAMRRRAAASSSHGSAFLSALRECAQMIAPNASASVHSPHIYYTYAFMYTNLRATRQRICGNKRKCCASIRT